MKNVGTTVPEMYPVSCVEDDNAAADVYVKIESVVSKAERSQQYSNYHVFSWNTASYVIQRRQ